MSGCVRAPICLANLECGYLGVFDPGFGDVRERGMKESEVEVGLCVGPPSPSSPPLSQ